MGLFTWIIYTISLKYTVTYVNGNCSKRISEKMLTQMQFWMVLFSLDSRKVRGWQKLSYHEYQI